MCRSILIKSSFLILLMLGPLSLNAYRADFISVPVSELSPDLNSITSNEHEQEQEVRQKRLRAAFLHLPFTNHYSREANGFSCGGSGGGTGRHVRLRGVCRKACGFESRPEHFYFDL